MLNELIDDEKSLISCDEFRRMFFTFFKGQAQAAILFDKLIPNIVVLVIGDKVFNNEAEMTRTDQLIEAEKMVSVQKLSKFIDSFNFYPVNVGHIHFKNNSKEMTYVMTSNKKGELSKPDSNPWQQKSAEEQRLLKLLNLVSFKINERFRNLREAFRQIDTDHSQSISINEFA